MGHVVSRIIAMSNGVDIPGDVTHSEVFEAVPEKVQLAVANYDNFDDNSISTVLWNESDTGTNITETNQRLEGKGNNSWNVNGLISDVSVSLITNRTYAAKLTTGHTSIVGMFGFLNNATLAISATQSALFYFGDGGVIYIWLNGANVSAAYSYLAGKTYNLRIVYQNPGWKFYIQSPDDATFVTEVMVYSTTTNSTGPMYHQLNFYGSAALSYIDNVDVGAGYTTTGPSPAAPWNYVPKGSKVRLKTARVLGYKNGIIVSDVASTDVKFKYAQDGGSLSGTWLTQSGLRAIGDITIANDPEAAQSITSITRSGNTATATKTAHGYVTGDCIIHAGADQQEYNGPVDIIKLTDNTYTYSVRGTPATPATGTITASRANSFKVQAQLNSDGTYLTQVMVNMEVFIELAAAAGGGSYLLDGGLIR